MEQLLKNIESNTFLVIGRAGIDFYPDPPGTKTEEATNFVAHLGGSSANIAVALSKQVSYDFDNPSTRLKALFVDLLRRFDERCV